MTSYDLEDLNISKNTIKVILWCWFIIGVIILQYYLYQ